MALAVHMVPQPTQLAQATAFRLVLVDLVQFNQQQLKEANPLEQLVLKCTTLGQMRPKIQIHLTQKTSDRLSYNLNSPKTRVTIHLLPWLNKTKAPLSLTHLFN